MNFAISVTNWGVCEEVHSMQMPILTIIRIILEWYFSNSLIIHEEKTKEITTVKEVWKSGLNYHKIL